MQAALVGAQEVGFTVVSITASLIAVFLPILLMGGIIGRLFQEFAMTLIAGDPDLDGDLADHHADDVRAVPAPPRAPTPERPRRRTLFQRMQDGYAHSWPARWTTGCWC